MKKLLIIALYFLISCGQSATEPNNNNENSGSRLINIDPEKIYTVRLGSKVIETKGSSMTNDWINYIGNKNIKHSRYHWYFDSEGNYWESTFNSGKSPRAELVGVIIKTYKDIQYLMGIYYNNKMVFSAGGSQFMLIYVDAGGYERGFYGGGREKTSLPDETTVWTHYTTYGNPLGQFTNDY